MGRVFAGLARLGMILPAFAAARYSLAPASRMGSIRRSRARETPAHGNPRRDSPRDSQYCDCAYGANDQRDAGRTRTVPALDRAQYLSGRHLPGDVGATAQGLDVRGVRLRKALHRRGEQPRPISVDQRQDRRSGRAAAIAVAGRSRRAGLARVQGGRVFQAALGPGVPLRRFRGRSGQGARLIRCRSCFAKRRAT